MIDFSDIYKLSNNSVICSCSKTHTLSTKEIHLKSGALNELPEILKRLFASLKPLIVCDVNTYLAAGKDVVDLLSQNGVESSLYKFQNGICADESAVNELKSSAADADYLIAVGSGTIHDVCRYTAAQRGISFVSVPTAASMDGYVSSVAAMTLGGCKVTTPAVAPVAVVADTEILSRAPAKLTSAGAGDILGKFTCLCDWAVSSLVSDEPFCSAIAELEYKAATEVLSSCNELHCGGKQAVEHLMYALLVSGLAMQLNGDSRPASGAEHHLSHFWEMRFLLEQRAPALHGAKVGVATVIISELYHKSIELFKNDLFYISQPNFNEYEIKKTFGPAAPAVIKENIPDPFLLVDTKKLHTNGSKIIEAIKRVPEPQIIYDALKQLHAPTLPQELGISAALRDEGLDYCILIRRRLTLLRILRMIH